MFSFPILSNLLNIGKNCCELRRIAERKKKSFARFVFRFCTFRFCDYNIDKRFTHIFVTEKSGIGIPMPLIFNA